MKNEKKFDQSRTKRRARVLDWAILGGLVLAFGLILFVVLGGGRHAFLSALVAELLPADAIAQN